MLLDSLVQLKAKDRSLNDIEQGGQGAALPKTPRGLEEIFRSPVHQGGDPGSRDVGFDPIDELGMETQFVHYSK